jgi:hypothetical protein
MSMRSTVAAGLIALMAATACAPASLPAPTPAPAVQNRIVDRLYFGRSIAGGGTVSDDNWAAFLAESVTPRFPAGLTAWRAQGQWRDQSGVVVREESFVLELIHGEDPGSENSVREIMTEYKARFKQEAVLRVRDRVEVQFYQPDTPTPARLAAPESQTASLDSVVQFLITSAATDFRTHRPPDPGRFRDVRIGHVVNTRCVGRLGPCWRFVVRAAQPTRFSAIM